MKNYFVGILISNSVLRQELFKIFYPDLYINTGRYIPSIVRNASTLKTLDLSSSWDITFKQVKRIFSACHELKELDLSCCCVGHRHKKLSSESIEFICKNVPSCVEKLNFSGQAVENDHLAMLVKRCKNLTELSLCKTHITQGGFNSLPDEIKDIVKCKVERYVKSEAVEGPKFCGGYSGGQFY